jgi:hypothetical protein
MIDNINVIVILQNVAKFVLINLQRNVFSTVDKRMANQTSVLVNRAFKNKHGLKCVIPNISTSTVFF